MLATIPSATLLGVEGRPVAVEVHVSAGLPGFTVVGLPDAACKEARDRVRAALLSSGLTWPLKRVTVNLAPSGLRKHGAGLDLPIAIGLLVAAGVLGAELVQGCGFVGELGLDGAVRPVPGVLALVDALAPRPVVVPTGCGPEARLVARAPVRAVPTLRSLLDALRGDEPWPCEPDPPPAPPPPPEPDLADVRGQRLGRWALEVAAAGGHHLLLVGPPGSGKTMLARRLPGLLPPLEAAEALDATRIRSAAGLGLPPGGVLRRPPFRAPHHGASAVSLVGGGSGALRPGEISLAHGGVLFLDELAEMPSTVLDQLRQPLEEGVVRVTRARASAVFPCRFQLVAAMNPCPCGAGGPPGSCRCSDPVRLRYERRVSGPLLDRFDLRVRVARPDADELFDGSAAEASAVVAARVAAVRSLAPARGVRCNAELGVDALDLHAPLDAGARSLLEWHLAAGRLTARGLHRIRRVARTVADLTGATGPVGEADVAAALELRADTGVLEPVP